MKKEKKLKIIKTSTLFGPQDVLKNTNITFEEENICSQSINGKTRKCKYFQNVENHIAQLRSELGENKGLLARQLRINTVEMFKRSLVYTQGKVKKTMKKKEALCPIALFQLIMREHVGVEACVTQCPFPILEEKK